MQDLCHSHSDEATIQQKISTIISCFINSSMPPALQIDIHSDQAQGILERRHKLGPYIFREAQVLFHYRECWYISFSFLNLKLHVFVHVDVGVQ